ncbi:MAG TPA: hypothetical protein DEA08_05360 [Planctomycetes bacterium]|nr:hypothetical protein [Planctomycetota bacterium]
MDATGEDFYALGQRFGTQVGVLSELHDETGHPYVLVEGTGFFDPRSLRYHRLQRPTPTGIEDNRLAIQILNDYEAEYQDVRPGDAPFAQPEFFTAQNRTTREADTKGRVALPSSHRRIIDSEDDRYALALTCRSVPLQAAEIEIAPDEPDAAAPDAVPEGMAFNDAGTRSGTHGSVTQTAPSVSVGGVTFFGGAAVSAARNALAQGGSVADAARAASAAARGLPPPPLQDAGTRERGSQTGPTETREPPPEPDRNQGGSVPLLNHPKGYVWSEADRIGLLGTLVAPEGAGGSYFAGREGTPIGPLPIRHDAQFTMGPELVGRVVFVSNDASEVPEGAGKPIKGELWADRGRANVDTELGLETLQWRPVIRVDADLPPSMPPPQPPPWTWLPPPREEEDEDDEEEDKKKKIPPKKPGGKPSGSGKKPPVGEGPGVSSGGGILVAGGGFTPIPVPPRRETSNGRTGDGDLEPIENPRSQTRDYEGPGEPCPNATAGVLVHAPGTSVATGSTSVGGLPVIPVPGGYIEFFGHPGLTPVPGGLVVGGEQSHRLTLGLPTPPRRGVGVDPAPGRVPRGRRVPGDDPGRVPLGLPTPPGAGIGVEPGPDDGVPRGRRVPGDDPGRIPLGLPGRRGPGLGFEPPLGGDRGIPRGYEERLQRRRRRERARRAREERDRREQERIDELEDLEERARDAGRERLANRVGRARERVERRRQRREDRRRRREEYKERKRREREERRRRREERRAERRRKREERRQRRNRERQARRDRGEERRRPPQGGYMIDVSDPATEAHSIGRLTEAERKQLEEDRRREEETRRRYQEEVAGFGHWNAANMPLPFFGSPGGPRSLEDWAHLATYQVQAMQRVVNGAFGGPSYLAGNIGVVHRNRPGNPPAGSRIGAHWTALPHDPALKLRRGQTPLEVVSILEAPAGTQVEACAGGVLEIVREHRGDGLVVDHRPLILLENDRSFSPDTIEADLISDIQRRFYVAAGAEVTGSKLRAHYRSGESGQVFEVARTDPERGDVIERLVHVDVEDGVLVSARGITSHGSIHVWGPSSLTFHPPRGEVELEYMLEGTPEGVLRVTGSNPEFPVTLGIDGHITVAGDASVGGKLFIKGSIDPTDLQLTPQRHNPIPPRAYGLWVSDGSETGTVKGGLYYERAGIRIRLDT